jgi:peroxiredoxin
MRAVLFVLMAATATAGADPKDLDVGDKLPKNVASKTTDGADKRLSLVPAKGKYAVITTMATWCDKWCDPAVIAWDSFAVDFKDKVTFYGLDISQKRTEAHERNAKLKVANTRFAYIAHDHAEDTNFTEKRPLPTTYVIDDTGTIRHVQTGFKKDQADVAKKKLRDALDRLQ